MSYTGLGMQGGVTQCYPFYERLMTCVKTEVLPAKLCRDQGEDFLECLHKTKQYAFNYKIHHELHKFQILNIPSYSEETDSFVSEAVQDKSADSTFATSQ